MLPAAQPLTWWLDTDNAPVISMHPAEDITGWTLAVEIAEADTGTVVLTLTTADPWKSITWTPVPAPSRFT
jgi:hypothetical protein